MLSPNCPWAFVAELAALQQPGLPQVFHEEIDSQLQWDGVQIIWCWPLPPSHELQIHDPILQKTT